MTSKAILPVREDNIQYPIAQHGGTAQTAMTHTFDTTTDDARCIDCLQTIPPDPDRCLHGDLRRAQEQIYKQKQLFRRIYLYLTDIDLGWGQAIEQTKELCKEWME
jgi:hypothetical protein